MAYLFDRRMNRQSVGPNIAVFLRQEAAGIFLPKIYRGTAPIAQLFAFRLPKQTLRLVLSSIADFPGFPRVSGPKSTCDRAAASGIGPQSRLPL